MRLTDPQRRALEDICETFCPSGDGAPSAGEFGVADAVLAAVALNPRASEATAAGAAAVARGGRRCVL